jgi:hypothetical protein
MRKVLTVGAGLILVLAFSSDASARGPANEFAVGSAKTEMDLFIADFSEHASLSAHNTTGPSCQATGQIVYKSTSTGVDFTAKIVELTIDPLLGKSAFFGGPITRAASGPFAVGDYAYFDATDSGMLEGTGDTFVFFTLPRPPAGVWCLEPGAGHMITHGNIVIKATGLVP